MGFFDTTHQESGKRTFWNSFPIMMCGKVMRRTPTDDNGWRPAGSSRRVDCGGCLRAMRRAGASL